MKGPGMLVGKFEGDQSGRGSDEGLTLETSASESLHGGQFTFSTQLIKPNYLVTLHTDAAPQFL